MNYEIKEKIGSGGFGEVYKVVKKNTNLNYALKKLIFIDNPEAIKRFRREIRLLLKLQNKYITPIIDYSLTDNPPWFVMPLAKHNLRFFLKNNYGEKFLWIFGNLLVGIHHAHEVGIIHRDLKPENILFFEDNSISHVAISDFGIGKLKDRDTTSITQTSVGLGTFQYMSPEQMQNAKNVDERADIYALGKILYEILCGEKAYPEFNFSNIPGKFIYIIKKACEKQILKRYQNVEQLANDFNLLLYDSQNLFKPTQEVEHAINNILKMKPISKDSTGKLARLLLFHKENKHIMILLINKMPKIILDNLLENHLETLKPVLKELNNVIDNLIPIITYKDFLDFYMRIFNSTNDYEIKSIIIKKLFDMGYTKNQSDVGTVLGILINNLEDESIILLVRDILKSNKSIILWIRKYLDIFNLPKQIVEILDDKLFF